MDKSAAYVLDGDRTAWYSVITPSRETNTPRRHVFLFAGPCFQQAAITKVPDPLALPLGR